ncbi:MAG: hypothetical protein GY768_02170 [Planctomycetaceae bacterium]|nr:hypothetical protein [Planctomycetaceae bacterium]
MAIERWQAVEALSWREFYASVAFLLDWNAEIADRAVGGRYNFQGAIGIGKRKRHRLTC